MERYLLIFLGGLSLVYCQVEIRQVARWCTVNEQELKKCEDLIVAIEERQNTRDFPVNVKEYPDLPELRCIEGVDKFDCMRQIGNHEADLIQLDPGLGYTAGEYYTMMPLMAEKYSTDLDLEAGMDFNAVALVRKDNRDVDFNNLRGKKSCHPGVGQAAGWVYPISLLIEEEEMPIEECNVPVKSAAAFFGDMCGPNGLTRYYNPFGNNPASICKNCKGLYDQYCTTNDPYAGYDGAFTCVNSRDGDVAFVRDSTVYEFTSNSSSGIKEDDFEILCPDGRRVSPSQSADCNWGSISSHIVMTSAVHGADLRQAYKDLLELLSDDFGFNGDHTDIFKLFESYPNYGRRNLLFTDSTKSLQDVSTLKDESDNPRDTYYTWAGEEHRRRLQVLNTCPIQQARWCVVSTEEMTKCENMIMAFAAKGLKPDLNCILGRSSRDCMDKIDQGDADLIRLDAADIFVAGKYFGLVPIAAEDYSGYDTQTYHAVAVARKTDSHLTIFNLKSRRSCHSGVMKAAGWITPVDKLIETGQINVQGCNVYFSVGQFFSKSCVPGILDQAYNPHWTNPVNLCEACASGGPDRCQRNNAELYFGNSGAFRCLVEKGGDVAFVRHTSVRENTDGRNHAEWARNRRSDDYELLCNDGTRADIDDWEDCNMGEIPSDAIVTADFKDETEREIYWTLLNYAQQFFASDSNPDFQMFESMLDHKDLIFQDSTVRLVPVPKDQQDYKIYLQPAFTRAMERMESIDCVSSPAGGPQINLPVLTLSTLWVFITVLLRVCS